MVLEDLKKTKISENPLVSVVIPTYNEERDIQSCLDSLKKQTYKKIEIIIVDDGSNDKTKEIVKKNGALLLEQEHQGPGKARNLGVGKAKGEIIILIDADMSLFEDYIEKIIKPVIKREEIGSIESLQYNKQDTKMQECWGKVVGDEGKKDRGRSPTTRAIAKKDFLKLGGFDSHYGYADDQTFFYKYGITFKILDGVKCIHSTPEDFKGVFKQSRWIGSSTLGKWIKIPIINFLIVLLLYAISPLTIIILSIRQLFRIKKFNLIFYMPLFIIARYFGSLEGYLRRIFMNKRIR